MNKFNQKIGTMSAGVVLALAFIACGGESGNEAAKRDKVKQKYDATLLSFDEAKKEVGFKDKECLKEPSSFNNESYIEYRFIKTSNGEIKAIKVVDSISKPTNDSFQLGISFTIDEFKDEKPQCFN